MRLLFVIFCLIVGANMAVAKSGSRGHNRQTVKVEHSNNTKHGEKDGKENGNTHDAEELAAQKKEKRKKRHAKARTGLAVGATVIAATAGLTAIAANAEKIAAG